MLELILAQITGQSFVDSAWSIIDSLLLLFMAVSTIALGAVAFLRKKLINSQNESAKQIVNTIDEYVIPILQSGQNIALSTKNQEIKIKQIGEILYEFMGERANEIKDKYQVKLDNLNADIQKTSATAIAYNEKLNKLYELIESLKVEK